MPINWKLKKFREMAKKRMSEKKDIHDTWIKEGGFSKMEDKLNDAYKKDRPDINSIPF